MFQRNVWRSRPPSVWLPVSQPSFPDEAAFDAAIGGLLAKREIPFLDLSGALAEPRFYFDTDHLNRAGVTELFEVRLKAIPMSTTALEAPRSD